MISLKKMLGLGLIFCCTVACEKYLAEKPSSSIAIPSTVGDFQALMDYQDRMNDYYPDCGDNAADYFYLRTEDWIGRSEWGRGTYVWDPQADASRDWSVCYERIFYTNIILEGIDDALLDGLGERDRDRVKGSALFIRGFTYLNLVQLFVPPYDSDIEDSPYGLPLRLTPDINAATSRATVGDTYRQIEADLLEAVSFLPDKSFIATRPSKAAAYAALSRLYVIMERYDDALTYADRCLTIQPDLMDYNDLDASQREPFTELNQEVIFHAALQGQSGILTRSRARVDSTLYSTYGPNDLRKALFFEEQNDGTCLFKGSYFGRGAIFSGLATGEVYLIKAESLIRLGDWQEGVETLKQLLNNRMEAGMVEIPADLDDERALAWVLAERERELAFRGGIRWGDLRRLNKDERFAKTLVRVVDGQTYVLEPNDPRYTFLIPIQVILHSGILQNER
ncbi:RagB/SusD family nutrient uptake outer membrane protein [Parapedobacter sp. GCM10030251]|uniref:RagB/SusD family nutrient uptake outer membrane protein n=1 Tax=Parapedobacter sp. GCM10030251 TaxID=3273419 RepID=UPI003608F054